MYLILLLCYIMMKIGNNVVKLKGLSPSGNISFSPLTNANDYEVLYYPSKLFTVML